VESIGVPCNCHHQLFRADHVALSSFGCLGSGEPPLSKVCVHIEEGLDRDNDVCLRIAFC
jgi:hypothetical protein